MKITKKTVYHVSFQVEAFWNEEGGMGSDSFGPRVSTLEEAIHQLELAKSTAESTDWQITCFVSSNIEGKGGEQDDKETV